MPKRSSQRVGEQRAEWGLQVQIGMEPAPDPVPLMEGLAGKSAGKLLATWLEDGGTLLELTTQGAPEEWPATLRRRIDAAVRLVRLGDRETARPVTMTTPDVAVEYLTRKHLPSHQEMFGILLLNTRHEILHERVLSRGHVSGTMVSVPEIMRLAIMQPTGAVITWHNHPSGNEKPSSDDRNLWQRMTDALRTMEIDLVDNLILTRPGGPWYSSATDTKRW